MTTPIVDFVQSYIASKPARLHMPGHKGIGPIGCEALDITEIAGADELYAPEGIVLESEQNAAKLFGAGHTLYSCEGSSHCIRAMLYLALSRSAQRGKRPVCLAGRNAHRTFLSAAALCDFDVAWLYPDAQTDSICACPITPEGLARRLDEMDDAPFCIYLTSPDYLGGMLDISSLAKLAHARGIPLMVDNAHGAYLRFVSGDRHPISQGADFCCDSAHKTLPVLTGGAYLHIRERDKELACSARRALALFGSTSPSYLILQSLDAVNLALAKDLPARLQECCMRVQALACELEERGFELASDEPMKLCLRTDGYRAASALRSVGAEVEYVDTAHIVMMFSPNNYPEDYERVLKALPAPFPIPQDFCHGFARPVRCMSIREATFAMCESVSTYNALNRICAQATVSCPPAVPIIVSGEKVSKEAIEALLANHITELSVVKE